MAQRPNLHDLRLAFAACAWFGCAVVSTSGASPPLEVRLLVPAQVSEGQAAEGSRTIVRHPWAIRDHGAERGLDESAGVLPVTRDGIEFAITATSEALPSGAEAALYVGLFSFSLTATETAVEDWMAGGNVPPPHNPLRLWTLFTYQYAQGLATPDELGDACWGDAFYAEFCVRIATCLRVQGSGEGGGSWRVAVPVHFATNYRLEAYLGDASASCQERPDGVDITGQRFAWWAPVIAEHTVPSRSALAKFAAFQGFCLLYVNKANWWWGHYAEVEPAPCWLDMMAAAVEAATRSAAAAAKALDLPVWGAAPSGLWLEFGVGSGKTTAAIAARLKALLGPRVVLHGFDSFQGLPTSWDHTKLDAGTFSTGGVVPPHLTNLDNVRVHVGLFSDTLGDLNEFGDAPVAFAHVDVDLYSSAVQVLSRIACQLHPGSLLVFDELVNYAGFELSGEYRAWELVASTFQIGWQYGGIFWQQAVPVVVTERGQAC